MRLITLNAAKAGMTRLREKGGADPQTLYDLQNGYISASKAPTQRPGTRWKFTLPANTKGLCAFKDKFHVFSAGVIAYSDSDPYVINTLRHPDSDFAGHLKVVHYAQPFLGYLYVVAEFDDGFTAHYWLRNPKTWQANTAYLANDSVQPTTPNGYYYQAQAQITPPAWAPGVLRAIGDVVQPSTANGWKYTVTAVSGDSPVSGAAEPTWPTVEGATVTEYVDVGPPQTPAAPPTPPSDPNGGRYDNPGGGQKPGIPGKGPRVGWNAL